MLACRSLKGQCLNLLWRQKTCLSSLQSKNVAVRKSESLRDKPKLEELVFGKFFSDHMLVCDYDDAEGWKDPQIMPFGDFQLSPAISSLHYAIQCFEGMKAYRTSENDVRLFRPNLNIERMQRTGKVLTLPEFDGDEFLKLLKQLIQLDSEWVPDTQAASLYIRPTFISTDPVIGVKHPSKARLFVITGPVGPYYEQKGTELFKSIKLMADPQYVRAWEGGIGAFKAGGNYAPTIHIQKIAQTQGCQQVLWLYGDDKQMTEAGTMNFLIYWINSDGEKELITAPLDSGLILPGVTRQSVLDMAREWGEFKVTERMVTMPEFIKAANEERIIEVFGAGTACMIAPIDCILYEGQDINLPTMTSGAKLSKRLFEELTAIQTGKVEHSWSQSIYT